MTPKSWFIGKIGIGRTTLVKLVSDSMNSKFLVRGLSPYDEGVEYKKATLCLIWQTVLKME